MGVGDSEGWGRWRVRLFALLGIFLISLSAVGWWLSTRVLDSDGFADVVTISSQRREVRDYIADQATLRLATTSNFVSAARPVVTDAISQAIASPPVRDAVRDFAVLAHDQIERFADSKRVNVSSAEAANTVRVVLEAASPALAKKLPPNVLSATTTISQSPTVDRLFQVGRWVRYLYIPVLFIGIGVLALTLHRARDRVHAIRAVGVTLAIGGALMMGIGASTPAFAAAAETNSPGRGDAVAQFIDVLVGRLYGAGKALGVVGLLIALAPGHDGGDLAGRAERLRDWIAAKRRSRRWRFAGGLALALIALWALTDWSGLVDVLVAVAGLLLLYVAIVICLRATGVLVTDHAIRRLHVRQVAVVFGTMVVAFLVTGAAAVSLVANNTEEIRANPTNQGCNGFIELCAQPVDSVVWAGSHNAMSSSAYDFFGAEHTITVADQLNSGIRFLMLDAYYGYDDGGLVRTNLAGAVNRNELRADRGASAVNELDRLGALTGAADTSGKKNDVYFCHDFCELGAVHAETVLGEIRDFLDRNLTDVVIIDVEDYVKPKDFEQALRDADLLDRVYIPEAKDAPWPSLREMVVTRDGEHGKKRRLVVMFEKQKAKFPWLLNTYDLSEETPFTFTSPSAFNCEPNRGGTGRSLLIVNHWINPGGLPDPVRAASTNSRKTLDRRFEECIAARNHLPNVIAVNFTVSGDLIRSVNRYNAAVARATRVTRVINTAIEELRATKLSRADRRGLNELRRLPRISAGAAAKILGRVGEELPSLPRGLEFLVPNPERVDEIAAAEEAPPTTTTTVPSEPTETGG